MILSDKQAMFLFDIAKDTIKFSGSQMGGLSQPQRLNLINEILEQQNTKLIDLNKSVKSGY